MKKKTGENLCDIEFGNDTLDMIQRPPYREENLKLDLTKIENVCTAKDIVKKIKRQAPDSEKMYLQIIYHIKELYPEYIKIS